MLNRRRLLQAAAGGGAAFGVSSLIPAWARTSAQGNLGIPALYGTKFDLEIGEFPVRINGRVGNAIGVNGSIPSPLIRFKEGEEITLNVKNTLNEDSSIHWHGLLVPFQMDGVPGITFPGIKPGETFQYKYSVPQNGTYWYHSHSGLQEPLGQYGPIIIDPKDADPVQYDREYVLVLSDWSFVSPYRIFSKLKKMSDSFNFQKRTVPDFFKDAKDAGFSKTFKQRTQWGRMRMSPSDISDVTGETYTYLINGRGTQDNWNGIFKPGERVRLRIINAASMSFFNIRIPGLPMTIVAADGLNVRPHEIDEFQIGVAETYDVIIEPKEAKPYAFVAESIDRSGQVVATFGPQAGMQATIPSLREKPLLTMKDMGMDHSSMNMEGMDHSSMDMDGGMDMDMDMDMEGMDHSTMDHSSMSMGTMNMDAPMKTIKKAGLKRGPGVVNIAAAPVSRLHEPGIGLENVPHRTLTYADLRSLEPNTDTRAPGREIELHLTSNMERYMWSFDGVKFAHVKESIKFYEGERVRMTLINDTMMPHPIHLHGMFFDLVNGSKTHKPRKHTIIVKPGEKLSFDVNAEHVGDWAFHCHLFFHMHAGMMQVVSLLPKKPGKMKMDHSTMDHSTMDHSKMKMEE
ncbi:MAG: copper-binding protein [Alphaproteobacteria bacterium]|nr:MAG: copper-binding protein [Alphaproteobacteria bacterium]